MPRKFDKYELIRELGRGAQAVVYEARDTKLDRVVALKVLLPGTRSEESVRRFEREARAAARLKHENVISIYEVGEWQDRHYMAMELVDDDPLDKRIGGRGLPVKEAVSIAKQVAEAVGAAHEAGIIHRDIKPGNILIEKGGRPKLTDFGLALDEAAQAKLTRSGTFVGTVFYVSPEQAKGKSGAADGRSDIYSLGAVLYEMLTGRPPFKAMTSLMLLEKIVNDTPRAPSEMRKGIPRDVETIALKCLEKEPDRRYQTAQEFAEDCARFLAGEPISARPASALYIARRSVARHKGPVLVTLGLAVIAALGAWVVYLRWAGEEVRPPPPPAASAPREKLAEIRAKIDPELTNYATARTALEAFPSFFPDAREETAEAQALLAKIDGDYAALAEKALEEAEREAAALAQESRADEAMAKLREVRDIYRHGPWLAERGEGLVAAALARIEQVLLLKASEEAVATVSSDTDPGEVPGAEPDKVTRVLPPAEEREPPVEAGGVSSPVPPTRHVPRPGDLRRGLVGWWKLDEVRGRIARDWSGRGNHGLLKGATWVKGRVGGALRFEGGGTCVELGNRSSLRVTGDQTIAMWICPKSLGRRQSLYAKCYGGEGTITLERDGTVHYFYGTSGTREAPYEGFRITRALPVASWTHLVIVRDLTNRKLRWYADGIETDTGLARFTSARASDLPAYLGRGYVGGFEGLLDDVRVYDRVLSRDEICELAAMGGTRPMAVESAPPGPRRARPGGLTRGLVGWWRFDEGAGRTVRDWSGRGNDGRTSGTRWVQGKLGGAISFDGTDDRVTAGARGLPLPDSPHTISLWAKVQATRQRPQCVVMLGNLEDRSTVHLGFRLSRFTVWQFGGRVVASSLPTVPGTWYHHCYTYNGTIHQLFVEGLLAGSSKLPPSSARPSMLVFGDTPGRGERFCGAIDDVRVYDRALPQNEILQLAAIGGGPAREVPPTRVLVEAAAERLAARTRGAKTRPRPVRVGPERTRLPARALSVFDSLVEKGDYAGAGRAARKAAADRANADHADVLLAAARVAATLEERAGAARRGAESRAGTKVELRAKTGTRRGTLDQVTDEGIVLSTAYTINKQVRRKRLTVKWDELSPAQMDDFAREGGWRSRGADGAVASAYLARARRDFSAAMKALGSAGGHPLAPHVREKVEGPGLAAAEAAARGAWARIERSSSAARIRSYRSVPAELRKRGWIGLSSGPYRSYCVAFSPDGRYLASGGYSSSSSTGVRSTPVGMWEASTGRKVKAFVGMANYALCMAFSRDGKKLAAGGQDGSVIVWDVASQNLLKRFAGQTQYVMAVAFSPDGRILAAASRDGTATLWDASTGNLLRSIKGDTTYRQVHAAAFSPDGRWLATGGYDKTAAMWALPAGVKKRLLTGHTGYVKSLAFSSNGRYVATGSYDNTAALWNVLTGTRVRTFEGLASCVYSVALSSDGRMLATGCADGTVALWDCSTSRKLKTFGPKAGEPVTSSRYVNSVAISPDGQFLATGGYRTTNRIWLIREKAKLAPQDARLLLEKLDAFERDHGRTEFALSVAGKIANMKAAASRWLGR